MAVGIFYKPAGESGQAREPEGVGDNCRKGEDDFILSLQVALLQKALAPWPRRASPLLVVNCGNGQFLPALWHSGFDAIATEPDPAMRVCAQNQPYNGGDVRAAEDAELPFEDQYFDWVICNLRESEPQKILLSVREALRVASRGLMVTFWNSFSLGGMRKERLKNRAGVNAVTGWRLVSGIVASFKAGRVCSFYTLCGPQWSWRRESALSASNALFPGLPIGAWAICRLDVGAATPFTGLPVNLRQPLRAQPEPVLEYSHRTIPDRLQKR